MIEIKTPIYVPERGGDVLATAVTLDLDLSKVGTPKAAAKAVYDAICASGYSDPKYIHLWSPEETAERGYGHCWSICWEEGPFEWTIPLSFELTGDGWYSEPWNSFILTFTL